MTSNLQKGLKISIDDTFGDSKHYNILLINTLPQIIPVYLRTPHLSPILSQSEAQKLNLEPKKKGIRFWFEGYNDTCGLEDPNNQKAEKSLDFLPGLDKELKSQRAPKFVNVEDYYVYSANTDAKRIFW